jgi:hypothetical protein
MLNMNFRTFLSILVIMAYLSNRASCQLQFGYGFTASNDLYQRYKNPGTLPWGGSNTAGSAILNLGLGPKVWVGNAKASFSLESQAALGILGYSAGSYKGLGMGAIPIIGRINFKGLSTFDREGKMGLSVGGGIQFNRTEAFGISETYAPTLQRKFFRTYVGQVSYGFGISGFTIQGIVRYGYDPDSEARSLNVGLQYDFNQPMLKKITNPESEL